MSQVLVRRIESEVVERLRERAQREGHSLEEECRLSLVAASRRGGLLTAMEVWRKAWSTDLTDDDLFANTRQRGSGRKVKLG